MSKLIAALLALTCLVWISAWSWVITSESEEQQVESALPSASLNISDTEFNISANDIFSFHQSDATPVIPGDNLILLQELAQYLKANPQRELELNGLFSSSERNKSPYQNLGIARAKAIEKLLLSEGTPEDRLLTSATEVQSLYLLNGRVLGGVNFIFNDTQEAIELEENEEEKREGESGEKGSSLEETSKEEVVKMLFYDKKAHTLDHGNRPYLDSLRKALQKRPGQTVIISGYSESEEEKQVSGNLAELRAKAVRRYLVDNGLRRRQIVVVSHPGSAKDKEGQRVELKVERD